MSELKTLKNLSKTTIMVPDTSKEQPCKHPLVPKEHIELDELMQVVIKWIKWLQSEAQKHPPHSHSEQCDLSAASILIQVLNINLEDLKND